MRRERKAERPYLPNPLKNKKETCLGRKRWKEGTTAQQVGRKGKGAEEDIPMPTLTASGTDKVERLDLGHISTDAGGVTEGERVVINIPSILEVSLPPLCKRRAEGPEELGERLLR